MHVQIINKTSENVAFSVTVLGSSWSHNTIVPKDDTCNIEITLSPSDDGFPGLVSAWLNGNSYISNDQFTYYSNRNDLIIYTFYQSSDDYRFLPASERMDLTTAIQLCEHWRNFYTRNFGPGEIRRGFFVPIEDITALANNTYIGVRCYFALENPDSPPVKILMVPVVVDAGTGTEKDKLIDSSSEITPSPSCVFNFTSPCPSRCDQSSPLYGPQVENSIPQ